uniref:Beta-defensin n=1 Tax=Canis lupus familiaris TaxID=9615 RepID=A0A8C0MWC3_CANLF
ITTSRKFTCFFYSFFFFFMQYLSNCWLGLIYSQPFVTSEFETDKICGYGTARCRRSCKTEESSIGICPNVYACCLKKIR